MDSRSLLPSVAALLAVPALAAAQLPAPPAGTPSLPGGTPTLPGAPAPPSSSSGSGSGSGSTQPAAPPPSDGQSSGEGNKPPPDVQAPTLSLRATAKSQTLADVLKRGISVSAGCDESCAVVIYLVAPDRQGRERIVGGAVPILPSGTSATFRVPIVAAGRKTVTALNAKTKVKVVGLAVDGARNQGHAQTRTTYVTVPAKKKRR